MLKTINVMLDSLVTDPDNPDRERGIPSMPVRSHPADAGADLFSVGFHRVPAHGFAIVDTGTHMEIPVGYAGLIRSRSGMNMKHGIFAQGTIDAGYTGSIRVCLMNLSDEPYEVYHHDRIAQLLIVPVALPEFIQVDELAETERNDGGFGSTGR